MKHLATKSLWVQEAIRTFGVDVVRVDRKPNPSDSLASYSNSTAMREHLTMLNCKVFSIFLGEGDRECERLRFLNKF